MYFLTIITVYPRVNENQIIISVKLVDFNSHAMFDDYYYIPLTSY